MRAEPGGPPYPPAAAATGPTSAASPALPAAHLGSPPPGAARAARPPSSPQSCSPSSGRDPRPRLQGPAAHSTRPPGGRDWLSRRLERREPPPPCCLFTGGARGQAPPPLGDAHAHDGRLALWPRPAPSGPAPALVVSEVQVCAASVTLVSCHRREEASLKLWKR